MIEDFNLDSDNTEYQRESEQEEYFEIQMVVINDYGEFHGVKAQLSKFHCDNIIKMSKTFYHNGGFELTCEDGSFIVFPPDVVQKSILKINRIPLEIAEPEFLSEEEDN